MAAKRRLGAGSNQQCAGRVLHTAVHWRTIMDVNALLRRISEALVKAPATSKQRRQRDWTMECE